MNFNEAINRFPDCKIFSVINNDNIDCNSWEVELINEEILPAEEGFYIIKAKNIVSREKIVDCYIDISMIERINDYAYFIQDNRIFQVYSHKCEGDVISAVAVAGYGLYDLFYSKIYPEIGINILKEGFNKMNNVYIAEDLAYILRDEGLNKEAIKYFQYAVDNEPSSYFIYGELAELFKSENNFEKYSYYKELFDKNDQKRWFLVNNTFLTKTSNYQ